jgi:hypothetical protein
MKWAIRFLTFAAFLGECVGVWFLLNAAPPQYLNMIGNLIPVVGIPTLLFGFVAADRN